MPTHKKTIKQAVQRMFQLLAEVADWTCDDWDDEKFAHWQSDVCGIIGETEEDRQQFLVACGLA